MNNEPFTNREILEKFNDIKDSLARIESQTEDIHNRLTRVESFKQAITGSMAVIIMVIVPLFSWMLYKVATIDSTVQTAVATALLPYSK